MSSVVEPAGRGIELSLSWLNNDLPASDLASAHRADIFLPVYDPDSQHPQQPSRRPWEGYIGRALVDGKNSEDWRIGTFYWSRRGDKRGDVMQQQQRPLHMSTIKGYDSVAKYQILCQSHVRSFHGQPLQWVPWRSCDETPQGAVIGGSIDTKPVYIARTLANQVPVAGEFQPFNRRAEFAREGRVFQMRSGFDVLTLKERTVHPDIFKVFRI